MGEAIINDRIAGTRITIYDVYHYLEGGWDAAEIAQVLPLSVDQVLATAQYIDDHKDEVLAVHRQIEERIARGNFPEIEVRRQTSRIKMAAWLDRRRHAKQERNGEGNPR